VWTLGEYRDKIPRIYPDALRLLAKSFRDEALDTKMQILNAAVKMLHSNPTQIFLLFKYILDLCRYDQNYDLRDRARMFRKLLVPASGECRLEGAVPYTGGAQPFSAFEQQLLASLFACACASASASVRPAPRAPAAPLQPPSWASCCARWAPAARA
jgi:hypothetical protein